MKKNKLLYQQLMKMIGGFNAKELQISLKFKLKLMGKNGDLILIQLKDALNLSRKTFQMQKQFFKSLTMSFLEQSIRSKNPKES